FKGRPGGFACFAVVEAFAEVGAVEEHVPEQVVVPLGAVWADGLRIGGEPFEEGVQGAAAVDVHEALHDSGAVVGMFELADEVAGVGVVLPQIPEGGLPPDAALLRGLPGCADVPVDRKSTRLNSSHVKISYAVFCL